LQNLFSHKLNFAIKYSLSSLLNFIQSPKKGSENDSKIIIRTVKSDDDSSGTYHSLRNELEQWKTRYSYVLSENAVLLRQKHDLEVELERLRREIDMSSADVLNENRILRDELEKIKASKVRNFSPLRAENKQQVSQELTKLRQENDKLKE
jgi:hypothetical protein